MQTANSELRVGALREQIKTPMAGGDPTDDVAVRVYDLAKARWFYGELLGGAEAECSAGNLAFALFGQNVRCTLSAPGSSLDGSVSNEDSTCTHKAARSEVRMSIDTAIWQALVNRLSQVRTELPEAPYFTWRGNRFEERSLSIVDPFDNSIEFVETRDVSPGGSGIWPVRLLLLVLFAAVLWALLSQVLKNGEIGLTASRNLTSQTPNCVNSRACIP